MNTLNPYIKISYCHKDVIKIVMSLKQPKNVHRELASSRFISNFKNIRKPGTYKYSDKRCKICQKILNETNKFTMSNGQVLEFHREIDCHSVNVIYYLKLKMCNKKEADVGKTIGEDMKEFKVKIDQHISDCKAEVSTCEFLRHV